MYSTKNFLAVALVSLLFSSCQKQQDTSSDEKVKSLEAELAKLKGTANQAPKKTGELTRELATSLLNEYFVKSPTPTIKFKEVPGWTNYEMPTRDGIIGNVDAYNIRLTETGLRIGGGYFKPELYEKRKQGDILPTRFVLVAKPIQELITEVTGIGLGSNSNIRDVEFITKYSIPEDAKGMFKYIENGRKLKWTFRKYDDGWRVEEPKE